MFHHPLQGGDAVVEPRGKRVFGSQAILGRHHDRSQRSDKASCPWRLEARSPGDQSAAVQPQHPRAGSQMLAGRQHQNIDVCVLQSMLGQRDSGTWIGLTAHREADNRQRQPVERNGCGCQQRRAQLRCHRRHFSPQSGVAMDTECRKPRGGERNRLSHLALRSEQQVGVEAGVVAGMAGRADLVDLERARCRRRSPAAPSARAAYGRTFRP